MSHIDEQIAEALTHGPDTLTYILARALTTARARVAELEARSAGMAALRRFAERCAQRDHQPDEHIGSAKCVACEAEDALRAIPSDRVLGDGMVQVDLAELEALREFHDGYTEDGECDLDEFLQKMNSISGKIAALRANQGGAAT